jgi:hypothetical protein
MSLQFGRLGAEATRLYYINNKGRVKLITAGGKAWA